MIDNKDSAEKMVPSSEEEENGGGEKEEAENGDGEKEGAPLALDTPEKMIPLPVLPEEKKKSEGLNLNNEVVKMRKEVKRVRALIIRKLTRQISALKKKKGNEKEVERNQRRADRLLEEIHAMKTLAPDLVTRTALQQNLSFEQVCRNPKCKISERAVARIATHPQFNRKIQDIKAGIEAFKEERMKGGKKRGRKVQNEAPNVAVALPHSDREERDVEDKSVEQNKPNNSDVFPKDTEDVTVGIPETADTADVQKEEMQPSKGTRPKNSETKVIEKNKPENKVKKSNVKPAPKDQEASDVESSDGETKEYFDDSTEERFYKQSSESDDSDGVDDFFLGKVSRFKKRKKKSTEAKKMHDGKVTTSELVKSELHEVEPSLKLKSAKLQSVFCSTLSGTTADRHKGSSRFRSQGNEKRGGGQSTNYIGWPKGQKQDKETRGRSGAVYKKHPASEEKGFASTGQERGRGRGDFTRQTDRKGGRGFSHQAPQQALHPSWEASKKRKEQEGQILAFQGKKIKFDEDD
ncbi:serum response factor-binding protein 1 isoform X1 [Thalassophryne amazonica]|uniref:serum response factor-binding protein 1 isoform X1 n=1 Tax=Thalassophryne amazonica TaxID=390379 RepID=UPI0014716AE6|nr:serum response factor-binding protein 1 isoform X1 [Thalassophryne amazonica]